MSPFLEVEIVLRLLISAGMVVFLFTMLVYSYFNPVEETIGRKELNKLRKRFYGKS